MKISITISDRGILRCTYPNGETHAYQIKQGWRDTVDHHIRDTLADLMVRFLMDRTIDMLALLPPEAEPVADVIHMHRVPKPTYSWQGWRYELPREGAGGLQLEGAGGLQLEGAGGLQLSIPSRKAVGIHQEGLTGSGSDSWVVTFDDNSILVIDDACAARAWAEEIYCAKPNKE